MRTITGYGTGNPEIWHALEHTPDERRRLHGWGHFDPPARITVGSHATLTFTFEIGEQAIQPGGRLALFWRWPLDWDNLQTDRPSEAGYTTVTVEDADGSPLEVPLEVAYEAYKGIEPFHHNLQLKTIDKPLTPGTRVRIVAGDTAGGGPGWRAACCAAKEAEFLMLADAEGTPRWTQLAGPNKYALVPDKAERLVVIGPADVVGDETANIIVRAEDCWGNAAPATGVPQLHAADEAQMVIRGTKTLDDPHASHYTVQFGSEGTHRLTASLSDLSSAESNPIRVHSSAPKDRVFWGDVHSGQTLIGCGSCTLADHYAYARDAAGLQFITHQANDHYVTVDDWQETREQTEAFHQPGHYIPYLGCEWSPYTKDGGDRNVFYNYDEPRMRRSARFFVESEPDPEPDVPTAPEFHEAFRDLDVLVNIHVGGRPTNLRWYEPAIERLAEIHSTHGTSHWFIEDCLQRGYKVAITAGTDGVMGRPGACLPGPRLIRMVPNGLTAIYAEELTRESLWKAMKARHCYGTTGQRIFLKAEVDGHLMGDEYETDGQPNIAVEIEGTAAIEHVDLLRGTEVIHTWNVAQKHDASDNLLRVMWSGAAARGTARRQKATWDGTLMAEGGEIEVVGQFGFYSPFDGVENTSPNSIRWQSVTAGNDAGLVLRCSGNGAAKYQFESEPCQFEFSPDGIQKEPLQMDAGGAALQVCVDSAPREDGPRHVQLTYRDEHPATGLCPYWVRVVQVDRGKAWSSPVYVHRTGS